MSKQKKIEFPDFKDRQGDLVITKDHNQVRVGSGQVVQSFENWNALKASYPDAVEAWKKVGSPSEDQTWHLIKTDSNLVICYPEEWIELTPRYAYALEIREAIDMFYDLTDDTDHELTEGEESVLRLAHNLLVNVNTSLSGYTKINSKENAQTVVERDVEMEFDPETFAKKSGAIKGIDY